MAAAKNPVVNSTREIVLSFFEALNAEDFNTARTYVSEDLKFEGVLGSCDSATSYFKDMRRMKLKYHIKKAFADENDVCLIYDVKTQDTTFLTCGWYHIEYDKIKSITLIFDPGPLILYTW